MSVDMHERRFREELCKHPQFEPNEKRDPRVWSAEFPAWRALFSSRCLYGHSTGYRLPSFEGFFKYCEKAYAKDHPKAERFSRYFKDDLRDGMRQRVSAWYESGMAETYLYVCLVDAIEDFEKFGIVLYDPRVDWKLKADLVVLINKRQIRISAFTGIEDDRPAVEARRDIVERERKKNTMDSSHWDNTELAEMPVLQIARTQDELQEINGVRVFAYSAINRLLTSIYQLAEVNGALFPLRAKPR